MCGFLESLGLQGSSQQHGVWAHGHIELVCMQRVLCHVHSPAICFCLAGSGQLLLSTPLHAAERNAAEPKAGLEAGFAAGQETVSAQLRPASMQEEIEAD